MSFLGLFVENMYKNNTKMYKNVYCFTALSLADARRKAGEMLLQLERKPGARTDVTSTARGRGSEYITAFHLLFTCF